MQNARMLKNAATIKNLPNIWQFVKREICSPMNETEFENFYHEHSRPLWAYVRRLADSREIADDVTQESFLKFLSAVLPVGDNKKAYLYRIATNLTYDHFRRYGREAKRRTDFDSPVYEEPAYEPFTADSGFTKIFDKLQMQERALLWLAFVEGHQHREIAEMLGLKPLSVRVLLFRAKRKLAALLDANNFEVNKL